jgi:3-isopropylmalate dehydrogenase
MKLLILPGDGIGPEITDATIEVLRALDEIHTLQLEFDTEEIGFGSLEREGTTLPQVVLDKVPLSDGVILGPVSHYAYPPKEQGGFNPSAELRVRFDLFANIRPCRSRPGLSILRSPMDVVIVRENTEGFYSDRNMFAGSGEFMPDPDSAFSIRKITRAASTRIARTAFELARLRGNHVTAVHKANVVKLSDGLFLAAFREVAEDYPDVRVDELLVDAAAAKLIHVPDFFDVLVTTNMYGDILSDEASELAGGLGLAGSLNASETIGVAQAQHGSAPDIAGTGTANPTSLILSAAMLLEWRGKRDGDAALLTAADHLERAVDYVLADPTTRTREIGGTLGTTEFTRAVIARLTDRALLQASVVAARS